MKTTTKTRENENTREVMYTVPTYYEYLYNVANSAVNSVLNNRYKQTGVPFYTELNSYRNQIVDKAMYIADCGGYGLGEVEAMKNKLTEDKKQLASEVRKAEKACTDFTLTGATRKAKAKDFLQKSRDYADICREVKRLSEDIKTIKAYNGKVTYSDRMGLINSAICGYLGYSRNNFTEKEIENARGKAEKLIEENNGNMSILEFLIDYSLQFKAMCRAVSGAMAELCNPSTEYSYSNKWLREATADEIKAFSDFVGGIGKEHKHYIKCYGSFRTFYTIQPNKDGIQYIVRHTAHLNNYQYMSSVYEGKDGNGNSNGEHTVDIDTALYKVCKDSIRYDSYFTDSLNDLEKLLDLMRTCNFTDREQLFINKVCKVAKLYDDVKMVLDVAMVRCGIISKSAQWTFISRLRKKLADNGYSYKHREPHKMPYNKAVKVGECKRVDLLQWAEDEPLKADFEKCVEWVKSAEKCERVTPTQKATAKECKVLWTMCEKVDKNKTTSPLKPILSTVITMSPTANIFGGKAELYRTYSDGEQLYTVIDID